MEAPFAVADVEACDIARWYPRFKGSTFNTRIVPVDAAFCAYLEEDRVVLPRLPGPAREGDPRAASWGRSGSDDEGSVHSGDGDEDAADAPAFPEVEAAVDRALDHFGSVFPKMNWSAPKDAEWMTGSLQCRTAGDVFMLLKGSDVVGTDLSRCFANCSDGDSARPDSVARVLALREWSRVEPAREFRCFVRRRTVVGLSQRHCSSFFPHLLDDRGWLKSLLARFVTDHVSPRFPRDDFVADVYVTAKRVPFLMDVNVFGDITDPCLFKWSELTAPGLLPDIAHPTAATGVGAAPSSASAPALDALLDVEEDEEEDEGEEKDEDEGAAGAAQSGAERASTAAQWPTSAPSPLLELRVVEEEPRMAPTARSLHGLPRDLLDYGAGDGSLGDAIAAMQAQQAGGGASGVPEA